jgi:hypothetical protein
LALGYDGEKHCHSDTLARLFLVNPAASLAPSMAGL